MKTEMFINTIRANMPFDKGFMFANGVDLQITPQFDCATYNTSRVPYIIYQEEGFKHWITKRMVTKNKGFISQKTVGTLNRINWSETLGIPVSSKETNKTLASRNNATMIRMGVLEDVTRSGIQ